MAFLNKYLDSFSKETIKVSGYFVISFVKNFGSSTSFKTAILIGTMRSTTLAIGFINQTNKNVFVMLKMVWNSEIATGIAAALK